MKQGTEFCSNPKKEMLSSIRYRECVLADGARYPNLINAGNNYKEARYSGFSDTDFKYDPEFDPVANVYKEVQSSNNAKDFTIFQ